MGDWQPGSFSWCSFDDGRITVEALVVIRSATGLFGCVISGAPVGIDVASHLEDAVDLRPFDLKAVWVRPGALRPHGTLPQGAVRVPQAVRKQVERFAAVFDQEAPFETPTDTEGAGQGHRLDAVEASGRVLAAQMQAQQKMLESMNAMLMKMAKAKSSQRPGALPAGQASASGPPATATRDARKAAEPHGVKGGKSPLLSGLRAFMATEGDASSGGSDSEETDSEGALDPGQLAQDMGSAGPPGASVQDLIQLQMLKQLKKLSKTRDDTSSSGSDKSGGNRKAASKFRGVVRLRKHIRRKPLSFVRRYEAKVRRKLGAHDSRKVWRYSDLSWKLLSRFGKMKGLWRLHWVISEILQEAMLDDVDHDFVKAALAQTLKAVHQVAIDDGDWSTAFLFLPWEDPLQGDDFAGDPSEMLAAQAYRTAMSDLRRRKKQEGNENNEEGGKAGGKGGKNAQA